MLSIGKAVRFTHEMLTSADTIGFDEAYTSPTND